MPNLNRCPNLPGRAHSWAGGAILLASALLVGCGGGGGGTSTPAKPTVKTGLVEGTITIQGGSQIECVGAVLADTANTGTVRLVGIDRKLKGLPYQVTGAFTLDAQGNGTITSNGSMTVYAPAGITFGGSSTTTCSLTGAMTKDGITGTLSGPSFNATFTADTLADDGVTFIQAAGTYATTYPLLSDGNDAIVNLSADGTFTGTSYPKGTIAKGAIPNPATALATFDNGTLQFVSGSQNIARFNATVLGSAAAAVQSGYSGLAILGDIDGTRAMVVMSDNGTSGLAGIFVKP